MIFSTTGLRKAISGAKFDAKSDFEVRLAVVPPKSIRNDEKLISDTQKMSSFFVFVFLRFLVPPRAVQG